MKATSWSRLARQSFVLGASLLVATALCAQAPKPVRIGFIGPFSGPSSDFGIPMLNGAQLAVDEINAAGGYLGRRIELVIKDDTANPDVGLQRTQELMQEGVVATIGFCNTGVAMKSLDLFQNAHVPLIVPCATGTPITAKFPAPESYIFRTSPRDALQAPFVVEDIVSRGWTKVAILADKTGYGEAGMNDVIKALAGYEIKPVYIGRFDIGVKDLRDEVKAAQEAGANVVFSYTVGAEAAVIAKARQALKWNVPQVGAWPLSFPAYINGAKEAAEGSLMAQTFIGEPSNERRVAFLSAYARRYATDRIAVPMAAAQAYDTVYLLSFALLSIRNGDLSGPNVKFALENLKRVYYGVVTTHDQPFSRDDKDAISKNMLVMGVVRNGAVTFAYAADRKKNLIIQRKKTSG
ncbi:ABC transporter substrate-binding protein [Curvibacter sp. APW13]|uniref:ABC transporter substrate-binding protein n=1 Tax=Curvibacter sp. APW13 TaxID=3077236 RepID=UPI0028DFF58F|nr:ABC transporter substrate-binding protein [Curvibacter sp. APW13]MDT8991911.1 ABC transporter substrate-binding protein [Curvibacter sp. APW13]